jgi:Mn-containing catalase
MYHHVKKLMFTVRVDEPDVRFGNMLLEQFGGANGELAAAMQYSIQGLNCEDPDRKDLLMDIGTEELSHLEVVGCLARMHLKPSKFDRQAAEADPLIAIAGGGGSICSTHKAIRGQRTTSRSLENSTSICAATSRRKPGPRSSTSG